MCSAYSIGMVIEIQKKNTKKKKNENSLIFRPLFWLLCIRLCLWCLFLADIFSTKKTKNRWKLVATRLSIKSRRVLNVNYKAYRPFFSPKRPDKFSERIHMQCAHISFFFSLFIFILLCNVLISARIRFLLGFRAVAGQHWIFFCLFILQAFFTSYVWFQLKFTLDLNALHIQFDRFSLKRFWMMSWARVLFLKQKKFHAMNILILQ